MLLKTFSKVVFLVFAGGLALCAQAADLSRFDGLWVADIRLSAETWEKAGKPMHDDIYRVLSGHTLVMDFTNGTVIEGIVIGYDHPEEPFTVTQREENLYALDIDGRRKRTFLWRMVDDSNVIVAVEGAVNPPLHYLKENLQIYSGLWKVMNAEALITGMEALMKKEKKPMDAKMRGRMRKILSSMHMRVDFTKKLMSWEDEKGGRIYGGPGGEFFVQDRQTNGAMLLFVNEMSCEFRILDADHISLEDRGLLFEMERVAGL